MFRPPSRQRTKSLRCGGRERQRSQRSVVAAQRLQRDNARLEKEQQRVGRKRRREEREHRNCVQLPQVALAREQVKRSQRLRVEQERIAQQGQQEQQAARLASE